MSGTGFREMVACKSGFEGLGDRFLVSRFRDLGLKVSTRVWNEFHMV